MKIEDPLFVLDRFVMHVRAMRHAQITRDNNPTEGTREVAKHKEKVVDDMVSKLLVDLKDTQGYMRLN